MNPLLPSKEQELVGLARRFFKQNLAKENCEVLQKLAESSKILQDELKSS